MLELLLVNLQITVFDSIFPLAEKDFKNSEIIWKEQLTVLQKRKNKKNKQEKEEEK